MSKADFSLPPLQRSRDVEFNGEYICGLRKHMLPLQLLRQHETILRSIATSPAGILRSVPGANRTTEQLKNAREGQLGAFKDDRFPYPRISRWCLDHPREYVSLWPLFAKIEEIFQATLPELYERQRQLVSRINRDFRLGKSNCFTAAQLNREYDTGAHRDNGNLAGTLSAMVLIGGWEGCLFGLPRFGIALKPEPGDLVFFDPLQVHGNTHLVSGTRTSLILFVGKGLVGCGSAEEELGRARSRSFPSSERVLKTSVRIATDQDQAQLEKGKTAPSIAKEFGLTLGAKPDEESTVNKSGTTMRKIVVAITGGSGAGKTTLRRQFTDGDNGAETRTAVHECWFTNHFECCAQQFKHQEELLQHQQLPGEHNPQRGVCAPYEVKWTLFKNGTAVCGNAGTGADSNGNIDAINFAIDRCLAERNVVIFDGVMASKGLVDHLQNHAYPNLGVVWVHLDVSPETAILRVLKRRQERGEMEMSEATKQGVLAFRLRGKAIWAYAKENYFRTPARFVIFPEGKTPEQIYQQLSTEVQTLVAAEEQNIVAA